MRTQFWTDDVRFGYCIKAYLDNRWNDDKGETGSSLPSHSTSSRKRSVRAIYHRVRECVWLQWRSMLIVVFILSDIIFLAVVFVSLDSTENLDDPKARAKFEPWLKCLIEQGGNPSNCFGLAQQASVNEGIAIAVLMLLAVCLSPL